MAEPGKVNQTSSPALKPIDKGFFNNTSWDKLKIKKLTPEEFRAFEVQHRNPDKLSYDTWENADEMSRSFMPTKDQYVDGYEDFISTMTEEWFNANREAIEHNMRLDNENYATESGWGFEKFKEGLTDHKLGIQHRIWLSTLMEQGGQGTPPAKRSTCP